MARTAIEEYFGCSVVADISADYLLRLPYGVGGARFYVLNTDTPGLSVTLPDARLLQAGGMATHVVANHGTKDFDVRDKASNVIVTVGVDEVASLFCVRNTSQAGQWAYRTGTSTLGTTLADRVPCVLRITASTDQGINLRELAKSLGFISEDQPYAVECTVASGVVVGAPYATPTLGPALTSGEWPAGSTLRLHVESDARIAGRGGRGGVGGSVGVGLLPTNGQAGGVAFETWLDTVIVNDGTIYGGGGGGGGGGANSTAPGGGGGGGAGYGGGAGGVGGFLNGQPVAGANGGTGGLDVPGTGGGTAASNGGNGGTPGTDGGDPATGGTGGDGGACISSLSTVTVTKLVEGLLLGPEVTF